MKGGMCRKGRGEGGYVQEWGGVKGGMYRNGAG